jgi:hypothetical protein
MDHATQMALAFLRDKMPNAMEEIEESVRKGALSLPYKGYVESPIRNTGHIVNILSKFDKVDNALRAYGYHALHPNEGGDLSEKVMDAWRQKKEYSWGDVLGIGSPNAKYNKAMNKAEAIIGQQFPGYQKTGIKNKEDRDRAKAYNKAKAGMHAYAMQNLKHLKPGWGEYLAKGGSRFLLDSALSAWNIIPGLGIAKQASKAAKATSSTPKGYFGNRGFVKPSVLNKLPKSEYVDKVLHYDVGKSIPGIKKAETKVAEVKDQLIDKALASPWFRGFGRGLPEGKYSEASKIIEGTQAGTKAGIMIEKERITRKALDDFESYFERKGIVEEKEKRRILKDLVNFIERPRRESALHKDLPVKPSWQLVAPARKFQELDLNVTKQMQSLLKKEGIDYHLMEDAYQHPEIIYKYWKNQPKIKNPVGHFPHVGQGRYEASGGSPVQPKGIEDPTLKTLKRTLLSWYDPYDLAGKGKLTNLNATRGTFADTPIVGSHQHPGTRVEKRVFPQGTEEQWAHEMEGLSDQPVYVPVRRDEAGNVIQESYVRDKGIDWLRAEPVPASLSEISERFPKIGKRFVQTPAEAYGIDISRKADKIALLETKQSLEKVLLKSEVPVPKLDAEGKQLFKMVPSEGKVKAGEVRKLEKKPVFDHIEADIPVVLMKTGDRSTWPKGYRETTIPGWENNIVHGVVANRMENVARAKIAPGSMIHDLEKTLDNIFDSPWGQRFKRYRQWWARNVLALHPGFYTANTITDGTLAYTSGTTNLPSRAKDAVVVMEGGRKEVIPGHSNSFIKEQAERYRATGSSFSNQITDAAGQRSVQPRLARQMEEWAHERFDGNTWSWGSDQANKFATRIKKFSYKWEDANNWAFREIGQRSSDTLRMAVFIDQLKKAKAAGNELTDDVFRLAANHVKKHMVDYGDLNHIENQLKNIAPFYSWYQGIIRKTLADVIHNPDKLHKAGLFFDFALEPMDPVMADTSPDYVKHRGAITGAPILPVYRDFGLSPSGNQQYLTPSRFMPYGTIDELMGDAKGTLWQSINPMLKWGYEASQNKNTLFNKTIDPISGGYLTGLINPLIGEDHTPAYKSWFGKSLPAAWAHFLNTILPQSRLLREVETMGRAASDIVGHPIWIDSRSDRLSPEGAGAWYALGGKFREADANKWHYGSQAGLKAKRNEIARRKNKAERLSGDYEQEIAKLEELIQQGVNEAEAKKARFRQEILKASKRQEDDKIKIYIREYYKIKDELNSLQKWGVYLSQNRKLTKEEKKRHGDTPALQKRKRIIEEAK